VVVVSTSGERIEGRYAGNAVSGRNEPVLLIDDGRGLRHVPASSVETVTVKERTDRVAITVLACVGAVVLLGLAMVGARATADAIASSN